MSTVELLSPFLWFTGQAQEAMDYYCQLFPDSHVDEVNRYPDEGLDPHFEGMAGKVLAGWFTLGGRRFGCLDGEPHFRFNESISFVVACQDQAEIDRYWEALSHVPESEQCGWCKDRFGVSWQVVPANMAELLQRPEQVQAMMQMKKIDIATLESAGR